MPTTLERVVHACVLLDFDGAKILTDPWFSERLLYRQGEPRSIATAADLPRLDGILISHAHYDHCDLGALALYPDKNVPIVVNRGTGKKVRANGWRNVTELDPWQSALLGPVRVTAAPASHGVPEVTYLLEADGTTVFFGADTRRIPELNEIAQRFPDIDLALMPINGLSSRPQGNRQEVMDAAQAAELTALLRPRLAVPIHYAYTSGAIGDRILVKLDRNHPEHYKDAAGDLAPDTDVRILPTGQTLTL
ncbi:MBL fold metallo-hydrolase [Streptomyces sp. NPDC096013]|uniref:MBL fold metallo-hydrolase n=1 Tax=Streptomyces sp. NPDC096013 TaxID=3366069 RepID=UPI00381EAAE0